MKASGELEYKEDDLKKIDLWIIFGVYFGFPKCCIRTFVGDNSNINRESNPFKGTGYLCCPKCEHREEDDIVDEINNNRYCSVPFINDVDKLNERTLFLYINEDHPEYVDNMKYNIQNDPLSIDIDWVKALEIHNSIFCS